MRNIDDIYVRRLCIYHLFIEMSICGINIQHPMIDLHKENTVSQENKCQGIVPTFMLESLVTLYSFGTWGIYVWYSQHYMPVFTILYSTATWSKLPKFMLVLLLQI